MANASRQLYQAFIKKGMPKEDAFFAVLDHFNELHWHDRNRYDERIKSLEASLGQASHDTGSVSDGGVAPLQRAGAE